MALRLRNPLRDLSTEQKIVIGATAAVGVGIATLATVAWASKSDPRPLKKVLEVAPGCTSYAVVSEQRLRDDLRDDLRRAAKEGQIDPFRVAAAYIRHAAPECRAYPGPADTPVQAQLFGSVFLLLLEVMQQEHYLSAQDYPMWVGMMSTWVTAQGASLDDL